MAESGREGVRVAVSEGEGEEKGEEEGEGGSGLNVVITSYGGSH